MDYENLLIAAIALVIGFLADALRKRLAKWINDNQEFSWILQQAAEIAVRAAEQMVPGSGTGAQKLVIATDYVFAFLEQRGIKITPVVKTLIRAAIEAAVLELKKPVVEG